MAYQTTVELDTLEGVDSYTNQKCGARTQALRKRYKRRCGSAERKFWMPLGEITSGTGIATFDQNGKYPMTERNAANYVNHDAKGIEVYDQWLKKGRVKKRTIRFKNLDTRSVNDARYFMWWNKYC